MSPDQAIIFGILYTLIFGLAILGLRALLDWERDRGKRLTWREVWNLLLTGKKTPVEGDAPPG